MGLSYGLWVIVMLKLITPPFVPIPIRIASFSDPKETYRLEHGAEADERKSETAAFFYFYAANRNSATPTNLLTPKMEKLPVEDRSIEVAPGPSAPTPQVGTSLIGPTEVLLGLWGLGSLLYFLLVGKRVFTFKRLLKECGRKDPLLESKVSRYVQDLGIKSRVSVVVTPLQLSPSIWWTPAKTYLLIPDSYWNDLDPDEQHFSLAHELGHLKRRDGQMRLTQTIITAIYW